jgi:hypothetical protein
LYAFFTSHFPLSSIYHLLYSCKIYWNNGQGIHCLSMNKIRPAE